MTNKQSNYVIEINKKLKMSISMIDVHMKTRRISIAA